MGFFIWGTVISTVSIVFQSTLSLSSFSFSGLFNPRFNQTDISPSWLLPGRLKGRQVKQDEMTASTRAERLKYPPVCSVIQKSCSTIDFHSQESNEWNHTSGDVLEPRREWTLLSVCALPRCRRCPGWRPWYVGTSLGEVWRGVWTPWRTTATWASLDTQGHKTNTLMSPTSGKAMNCLFRDCPWFYSSVHVLIFPDLPAQPLFYWTGSRLLSSARTGFRFRLEGLIMPAVD